MAQLTLLFVVGAVNGCRRTVVDIVPVASIRVVVSGTNVPVSQLTLLEGAQASLEARLTGPGGEPLTGRTVAWSTADPGVASIGPGGTLSAVAEGNTTITASAEGVQSSVAIIVLRGPTIELSVASLLLQGPSGLENPIETAIDVVNVGNGSLVNLTASTNTANGGDEWLQASLANSTAPTVLTVSVLIADLAPGAYSGTVLVSDPSARNGSQAVDIDVDVGEALPEMALDLSSVAVGAAAGAVQPATQDVAVTNDGGGTLDGLAAAIDYAQGAGGWLTATFTSQSAPATLQLSASARLLAAGTYVADVEVTAASAPGASAVVQVTFTVS